MFTLQQIEAAHDKVKSGADFPHYIQDIKKLGVTAFETWTCDSHTVYFGATNFCIESPSKYDLLAISANSDKLKFASYLKDHQAGNTDYFTFCQHCAETGVEKWVVSLEEMTCTYFDRSGNLMLVENVPAPAI